ncbi:MAG TPA: cobalamin-binding protein [Candidatus Binataceae bacterium]|nr:cobalamin-binding protein [Candidatus Binataceae bacterium]
MKLIDPRVPMQLRSTHPLTGAPGIGYLRRMALAIGRARLAAAAALLCCARIAAPAMAAAASPVQRIVSLAPSVTETLFALGAGDQVVGVSQYCDYPPAATRLPRVGSFLTPNVEAIIGLRPTLVIGLGLSSDTRELEVVRATGCSVITVGDDSLQAIEASIRDIGGRVGRADAARALVARLDARIASVRARVAGSRRPRVLMLVGHEPIVAVGWRTYLDDLLTIANSENIAHASGQQWPELSIEYIIATRPDVILDGQMGTAAGRFWNRFSTIPAVRNHRVYGYPDNPILHPGPRVGSSLEMLAAMIHPARFPQSAAALHPVEVAR